MKGQGKYTNIWGIWYSCKPYCQHTYDRVFPGLPVAAEWHQMTLHA